MTEEEIAIRVRNIITEQSPAAVNITVPKIIGELKTFLDIWGYEVTSHPYLYKHTEGTYSLTVAGDGTVSLVSLLNGAVAKIRLEYLPSRVVYLVDTSVSPARLIPMEWRKSYEELVNPRYLVLQPAVFLDNVTLRTSDGVSLTGLSGRTLSLTIQSIPIDAQSIPVMLVHDFIDKFAKYLLSLRNGNG